MGTSSERTRTIKRHPEISGKEWLKLSISIWDDIRTNEEKQLKKIGHPAIFPESLADKLIKIFSSPGDLVLDPFMGLGTTLLSAAKQRRDSLGFEINPEFLDIAKKRLELFQSPSIRMFCCSCLEMDKYLGENTVDFFLTSPPYWDVLSSSRTADNRTVLDYGNNSENLGNIHLYQDFLDILSNVMRKLYICLKPGKYGVLIVGDIRKKPSKYEKSIFYPFHLDLTHMMNAIGFRLSDFIIWDRRREYNSFRPLGYPTTFIVNKAHEYICIFNKPQKE